MKHLCTFALACAVAMALSGTCAAQTSPQMNLPRTTLTIGIHQIQAQVAQTPDQHATGLMFRTDMAQQEGMRYVLEVNQGWFAKKGIKAGAQLRGAPFQPTQ